MRVFFFQPPLTEVIRRPLAAAQANPDWHGADRGELALCPAPLLAAVSPVLGSRLALCPYRPSATPLDLDNVSLTA